MLDNGAGAAETLHRFSYKTDAAGDERSTANQPGWGYVLAAATECVPPLRMSHVSLSPRNRKFGRPATSVEGFCAASHHGFSRAGPAARLPYTPPPECCLGSSFERPVRLRRPP